MRDNILSKLLAAVGFGIALSAVVSCSSASAQGVPDAGKLTDDTPYDRAYWARPHNTYIRKDYPSLGQVLNRGNRVIELDVYTPYAGTDRFLVKHDPGGNGLDINNCNRGRGGYLDECIADIAEWIRSRPGEYPVTIQIDMKGTAAIGPWIDSDLRGLQATILRSLGDIPIVTPSEVRRFAGSGSLREGVYKAGWPSIGSMRGKVVVQIMGGPIGSKNQTQKRYIQVVGTPAFFVCPNAESAGDFDWNGHAHDFGSSSENAWVVCGNIEQKKYWYEKTESSNRNRQLSNLWSSDASHFARFDRMYLAVGWGASMISRDDVATWSGKLPLNGLRGSVPTVLALRGRDYPQCVGLAGSPKDGTNIIASDCNIDRRKTWVYSDETQFRTHADTKYCFDVDGGKAANGKKLHLWDCDGGDSEKWQLRPDGSIVGIGGLCATMQPGNGAALQLRSCNGDPGQFFSVIPGSTLSRKITLPLLTKKDRRRLRWMQ